MYRILEENQVAHMKKVLSSTSFTFAQVQSIVREQAHPTPALSPTATLPHSLVDDTNMISCLIYSAGVVYEIRTLEKERLSREARAIAARTA